MLFRQMFDRESCTYTYLLSSGPGREAIIIDPVNTQLEKYLQLINELNLKLVVALDTHTHADHITATGQLRQSTQCSIAMGEFTKAECVDLHYKDSEKINVDGVELVAMYTPGHTDEHFSFVMQDRVFSGDCLLIRSTGRTDFQNGDSFVHYDSLFNKLLKLPEAMLVYPAHDYKGATVSTIGEERRFNPRLQVSSPEEYAEIMDKLNMAYPKMIDVAVPANLKCGLAFEG